MEKTAQVLNQKGLPLDPTHPNKAMYLVRTGKATLVSKTPLIIQLNYELGGKTMDRELGAIKALADLINKNDKKIFAAAFVRGRLVSEANKYPNDKVINHMANIFDKIVDKNPLEIISAEQISHVYNDVAGLDSESIFTSACSDLLPEKQLKQTASYELDNNLEVGITRDESITNDNVSIDRELEKNAESLRDAGRRAVEHALSFVKGVEMPQVYFADFYSDGLSKQAQVNIDTWVMQTKNPHLIDYWDRMSNHPAHGQQIRALFEKAASGDKQAYEKLLEMSGGRAMKFKQEQVPTVVQQPQAPQMQQQQAPQMQESQQPQMQQAGMLSYNVKFATGFGTKEVTIPVPLVGSKVFHPNTMYYKGMRYPLDTNGFNMVYAKIKDEGLGDTTYTHETMEDYLRAPKGEFEDKNEVVACNLVERELKRIGFQNPQTKLSAKGSDTYVVEASLSTGKGLVNVYVPVENNSGQLNFPTTFFPKTAESTTKVTIAATTGKAQDIQMYSFDTKGFENYYNTITESNNESFSPILLEASYDELKRDMIDAVTAGNTSRATNCMTAAAQKFGKEALYKLASIYSDITRGKTTEREAKVGIGDQTYKENYDGSIMSSQIYFS